MREFKFRAFIDGEMVILPFAALQYFDFEGSYALSFVVDGYSGFYAHEMYESATERYCKNVPIMQFTGLKDKNGKEIYEGDIAITDKGHIVEIRWDFCSESTAEWDFEYTGFCLHNSRLQRNFHFDKGQVLDVIGNRYQNPDLLIPPPLKG